MAGKSDIVEFLAENLEGMTRKQATEVFEAVFGCIGSLLASEERVQITQFGTFSVSHRAERQGINPATKEPMTIPASSTVRFKPSAALKSLVNE